MGIIDDAGNVKPEVATKLKTLPQGAATTVWCATSPQLNDLGGVYCENADVAVLDLGNLAPDYADPSTQRGVQPYSLDEANAKRLWSLSEEMTGITFPVD
jgi:hypothetical protein